MADTKPYWVWRGFISRCRNKKNKNYKGYGGRGITFCRKWKTFAGFWEDMHSGYKEGLSLDRINNNGNYCKENCRWATVKQQARNRRNNHLLTFNKKTYTITEWAQILGIKKVTLRNRVTRCAMPIEKALTKPVW